MGSLKCPVSNDARAAAVCRHWDKCSSVCVLFLQEFIEELLSPPFGGLVAFVKEAEALIERGQAERLRGEEGVYLLW